MDEQPEPIVSTGPSDAGGNYEWRVLGVGEILGDLVVTQLIERSRDILTAKSEQGVFRAERRTRHGCVELKAVKQDTGRVSGLWTTEEVRTPDVLVRSLGQQPA